MNSDVKQKLQIVLEGQGKEKTADEICQEYGISRNNYYKMRRELTSMALDFFNRYVESNGDNYYNIIKEQQRLQKKVQRLTQEKAKWELKYKWLTWQLETEKGSAYAKAKKIQDPVPGGLKAAGNNKR